MSRILLRVAAALLLAGMLLVPTLASMVPTAGSSGSDPVTITTYEASYTVSQDGTLDAVETITAEFPWGRHGIFRYWDLADFGDPSVRYRPRNIDITLDGDAVPVEMLWEQGRRYRVAKIGDADSYVSPGSHTYQIRYEIRGALGPNPLRGAEANSSWSDGDSSRSEFVWDVVGSGWSMSIDRADITVNLPTEPDQLECSILGRTDCSVTGEGTSTLRLTAADLPANTPVTIRAAMDRPAPDRTHLPWSVRWDRMLGSSLGVLVAVVALSIVAGALGYLLDRLSREREPGFPVVFDPPAGLGPVQTAYITSEQIPRRALTATLLHQAEQGLTTLTRTSSKSWTITGLGSPDQWAAADPVSQAVGTALGVNVPGSTFTAGGSVKSGQTLSELKSSGLPGAARTWATSSGAAAKAPKEKWWRILTVLAFVAAAAATVVGAIGLVVLPFGAFTVGAAGLLSTGVGSRRTTSGRALWSHAGGFRRFLSTDSAKDRFDFSGREELYTAFIPYAVAFDCADRWARKYETATGQSAPVPIWYSGGTGHSGTGFFGGADAFSSFESSISSSISAYAATQRSSSSSGGGGGGGFSGGGGGGGGGGSW